LALAPAHTAAFFIKQSFATNSALKSPYVTFGGRFESDKYAYDTYSVVNNQLVDPWKIKAHFVFDASVGADFDLGGQQCGVAVGVKNLLDKEYLSDIYRYASGRQLFLELSMKF
jgi:outer membrane receptor protein involved in Fe transport